MSDAKQHAQILDLAFVLDGLVNTTTGRGVLGRDPALQPTVGTPKHVDEHLAANLWLGSDVAANAIEIPADDTWRKGVIVKGQTRDETEKFTNYVRDLGAIDSLKEWDKNVHAYGGAILYPVLTTPSDPATPLRDSTKIRSVDGFEVFHRWETTPYPVGHLTPDFYRISTVHENISVFDLHSTRVLRGSMPRVSRRYAHEYSGWGPSIFTKLWDPIRGYMEAWDSTNDLLRSFAQAYFKMKNLAQQIASSGENNVRARIETLALVQSTMGILLLDSDSEEYGRQSTPVSGLSDILEQYKSRIAHALRMPQTLLFGQSPGGLNATGESDLRLYYDRINARRNHELRRPVKRLVEICLMADNSPTGGKIPEYLEIEFPPLWEESRLEKAQIRNALLTGDKMLMDMGAVRAIDVATARGHVEGSREADLVLPEEALNVLREIAEAAAERALNPPAPVEERADDPQTSEVDSEDEDEDDNET